MSVAEWIPPLRKVITEEMEFRAQHHFCRDLHKVDREAWFSSGNIEFRDLWAKAAS
jgi:hypothetical protein